MLRTCLGNLPVQIGYQIAGSVSLAKHTPQNANQPMIGADAALGEDPAGGFRITGIDITIRATVPGVDADRFAEIAATAERTCPVTKALAGTTISLDAALGS